MVKNFRDHRHQLRSTSCSRRRTWSTSESADRNVHFSIMSGSVHDGVESVSKATAARRGDSVGKQETIQKGGDTDFLSGIVHAVKTNKDCICQVIARDGSLVIQLVVVIVFSSTHRHSTAQSCCRIVLYCCGKTVLNVHHSYTFCTRGSLALTRLFDFCRFPLFSAIYQICFEDRDVKEFITCLQNHPEHI